MVWGDGVVSPGGGGDEGLGGAGGWLHRSAGEGVGAGLGQHGVWGGLWGPTVQGPAWSKRLTQDRRAHTHQCVLHWSLVLQSRGGSLWPHRDVMQHADTALPESLQGESVFGHVLATAHSHTPYQDVHAGNTQQYDSCKCCPDAAN